MGAFSKNARNYATRGLAAFPVDTQKKRPLVRGWQRAIVNASLAWIEKFPDADGLGINCGPASGITEIDVDAVGHAPLAAALDRFGETPIIIQTASEKWKLWYRHNGETRRIRVPDRFPVDVLGSGFTIAPPSYRADLGKDYRFITGSLDDVERLPKINSSALERPDTYAGTLASETRSGERNVILWQFCMVEARRCGDLSALIKLAQAFAARMPEPLGASEIERAAQSAWGYEARGQNYLGQKRPCVTQEDAIMDALLDQPDALVLLQLFRRFHNGGKDFSVAPSAMSQGGTPPWHRSRIERARDLLIARGFLELVAPPRRGVRAGVYRLIRQMSDSGKDHIHPLPPLPPAEGAA